MTTNILATLNLARQGMMVSQIGIDLTGHNTANVNTEGYSRRRMSVVSRMSVLGGGADVTGIKRYTDDFATERLVHEQTLQGYADKRGEILSHISDLFNDLENNNLGSALDAFYGSFRLLESNPNDLTIRQEVLARTEELAQAFNRISSELNTVSKNTDGLLRASASEINVRTEELTALNEEVVLAKVEGKDTSDILDRREQLIREMSEHGDISYIEQDNGQITVFLEGGLPLVEGNNRAVLEVRDDFALGAQVYYTTKSSEMNITSKIDGGAMGGILETRQVTLPAIINDLDQLAYDIVNAYNNGDGTGTNGHANGYGLDGVTGRNLFTPLGGVAGAAELMSIDPSVYGNPEAIAAAFDPAADMLPGDNRNALFLASLADEDYATGGTQTFNEAYSTIVGDVGVATRRAESEAEMRSSAITRIENIRDSAAAVSLDEEMTNLVQYQRAYQASARVLDTVTTVLDTILGLGK